jgi:hypothetical protein
MHDYDMEERNDVHIIAAERLSDGILVKFEDGNCVFYSAELLAENIPRAKKLDELAAEW